MAHVFTTSYLADSISLLRYYKGLADRAMAQLSDRELLQALGPEENSIAIIVKHLAGNLRSRWTDFLTTDGEKADRNRDSEFEAPPASRAELLAMWEHGWRCLLGTLETLTEADLTREIRIRTEPHSVMQAINRALGHIAHHAGEIVFLARHWKGGEWQTLSVPRGQSAEFSARVASGQASQR